MKEKERLGDKELSGESDVSTSRKLREITPKLFKVLLLNDDYTTMEFVVDLLATVFHKTVAEANSIMLNVHLNGKGLCGIYPHEIAETKISLVHSMAREEGFPLKCSIEEA